MSSVHEELRDQGRGVVGALLLGMPLLYTMETWWLGWWLPVPVLLGLVTGGLLVIVGLVQVAGFRHKDRHGPNTLQELGAQAAQLMLQSVVAATAMLMLLGVMSWGDPFLPSVRLVLIQIVPLGFGAALANSILRDSDEQGPGEAPFPKDIGLFALGALFFCLPIAPTEEVELIAARVGWLRMPILIAVSLLLTYLALFQLEFRGTPGRTAGRTTVEQWGECLMVYVVGLLVVAALLVGFGHFQGQPPVVWVQEIIVMGLPAALGGAVAQVAL